ncbi:MmcQ/YjbR family DNA-binding protein [Myxococcota bacterium]|nr:MmcQ/YjbR family DNA-binding protein [Myxococcota bacterium]
MARTKKPRGVTADTLRRLALALPDVTEVPHMDRHAFRTPKRIFATLAADGTNVNLNLDPEHQALLAEAHAEAFTPIAGGWGRMGWTHCLLDEVTEGELTTVLAEAHKRAQAPAKKAAKSATPKKAPAKKVAAKRR